MKTSNLIGLLILVLTFSILQSCKRIEITGQVIDVSGAGQTADIEVISISKGDIKYETKSNDNGTFSIKVKPGDRYIINARKEGYAFASKVYNNNSDKIVIRLTKAMVVTVNANAPIVVKDSQLNQVKGIDSSALVFKSALARIPFVYNAKGALIDFKLPSIIQESHQSE